MTYATEFPGFDNAAFADELLRDHDFADTSWGVEPCPSFTCDVFVLWIEHADRTNREHPNSATFVMQCEGETMLETDSWADVLAFINDGKRDFPEYSWLASMSAEFCAWTKAMQLPQEGDATELMMFADLKIEHRDWLAAFIEQWDAAQAAEDEASAYAPEEDAALKSAFDAS